MESLKNYIKLVHTFGKNGHIVGQDIPFGFVLVPVLLLFGGFRIQRRSGLHQIVGLDHFRESDRSINRLISERLRKLNFLGMKNEGESGNQREEEADVCCD